MVNKKEIICNSGGCQGADMMWETECKKYNIKTISYSFQGHIQLGENQIILTKNELNEGWNNIEIAEKTLHRNLNNLNSTYVRSLLARNWFQVENSETIFAVGMMESDRTVSGGTGWAVQMAIDNKMPVFLFEQNKNKWFLFDYYLYPYRFKEYGIIPKITTNFAGIGTRKINENGINAIRNILKLTFGEN